MRNKNLINNIYDAQLVNVIDDIKNTRKSIDYYKLKINDLNNEISTIQNNMINMFSTNKLFANKVVVSNPFPNLYDLSNNIKNYCNNKCPSFFIEYLKPEFDFKGIIYFYQNVFEPVQKHIEKHFDGLLPILKNTLQNATDTAPLECVLNKSYQVNWVHIVNKLLKDNFCGKIAQNIQNELDITTRDPKINIVNIITKFIKDTLTLFFQCYTNTPRIYIDLKQIGNEVVNDYNIYECFVGNLKHHEKGYIILPKFIIKKNNGQYDYISLPKVISENYSFDN